MLERITRRHEDGSLSRPTDIGQALGCSPTAPLLIIAPHDDDAQLGAGLAMAAADAAGIPVHVLVVTDGRMGYCDPAEREEIVDTRRAECAASCAALGVPAERLHRLDLPDATLHRHAGAWHDDNGALCGLTAALTAALRRIRPGAVILPTAADIHPDHRQVAAEAPIACFHSANGIWGQLGPALPAVPALWAYACYAPFPDGPALELVGSDRGWARKQAAVRAYASQPAIIQGILDDMEQMRQREFFERLTFPRLEYQRYFPLFEQSPSDHHQHEQP